MLNTKFKTKIKADVSSAAVRARDFIPLIIEALDCLGVARKTAAAILGIAPCSMANYAASRSAIPAKHLNTLTDIGRHALTTARVVIVDALKDKNPQHRAASEVYLARVNRAEELLEEVCNASD